MVFYFLLARDRIRAEPEPIHIRLVGEVAIETAMGHLDVDEVADWLGRILGPIMDE